VPTLLLAELAASISRVRRDPIRARVTVAALQALPFITFIDLDRALGQTAAEIAADRAVKGADAVYIAVAQIHRCVLVTLDQEQARRAAPIVTVMTPQEALAALQEDASDVSSYTHGCYPFRIGVVPIVRCRQK
jgi:predicted nucleic acid-binding protein